MNQQPKALHVVLNGVVEDSRVLKCAWSLGNAGWDVVVVGASPHTHEDSFEIGYARIDRLPLKPVFSQALVAKVLRRLRRWKRGLEAKVLPERMPGIPNFKRAKEVIIPFALDFAPDVIHAHDYTALPIAGAVRDALAKMGHAAALIYDAHEYVPGVSHLTKPLAEIYSREERRLVKTSSAVLSVSEGMSDLLIPHLEITTRPDLVANDPLVEGAMPSIRHLRQDCGLDENTPLMVYSGAVAPQRGVQTAAEALRSLPGVHLVVIANPANATVIALKEKFADVADRFHVQPYVPNSELVSYLSGATIGLIPIVHRQNHEISLITKFGEYMQAKLPILVSDVKTMAAEVRRLGIGEVFIAEDVADFIRAAQLMLANPGQYSSVYTSEILGERTWEKQAEGLVKIYNRVAKATPVARPHKPFAITQPVRR
jgi:glycosyltransferase involved in cell wall biosynthesis